MTRTTAREIAIQLCFAASAAEELPEDLFDSFFDKDYYATLSQVDELYAEYPDPRQLEYIRRLVGLLGFYRLDIDKAIERNSHGWKLNRISKTALAVLRCAICEILYMDDIPNSAAINEAIELDKGYDDADTVSFVNGVLGGFMRSEVNAAPETASAEEAQAETVTE